jgi:hypothetical protein
MNESSYLHIGRAMELLKLYRFRDVLPVRLCDDGSVVEIERRYSVAVLGFQQSKSPASETPKVLDREVNLVQFLFNNSR